MNILHYALGFPPYRTGGLVKFAMDLMKYQAKNGHTVSMLWPGEMQFRNKRTRVASRGMVEGILSYELINPLPVPLDEGIVDIDAYTAPVKRDDLELFLKQLQPQAIHIHTLMGLPKEFVQIANELNIPTIFTTHDYFGICPKVTLFRDGVPCEGMECLYCASCNKDALSLRKITLMQSGLYRQMKDTAVMKAVRKQHRDNFFEQTDNGTICEKDEVSAKDYRRLRRYYQDILESVDVVHYNSQLAKEVYERYISPKSSEVISISHSNIAMQFVEKQPGHKLRILYLAPPKPFKGFRVLTSVLDELEKEYADQFELHIYVDNNFGKDYICGHPPYQYSDLKQIMSQTDVLVAPSVWYETFGFTVLEALSFGVPVIASSHVGAKDLIHDKNGWIYDWDKPEQLRRILTDLLSTPSGIDSKRADADSIVIFENMAEKVTEIYKN